jgi:hypothetical protein
MTVTADELGTRDIKKTLDQTSRSSIDFIHVG